MFIKFIPWLNQKQREKKKRMAEISVERVLLTKSKKKKKKVYTIGCAISFFLLFQYLSNNL